LKEEEKTFMAERKAKARWTGTLKEGRGDMELGSGAFSGSFSFGTRMGEDPGTNPEELVGAALAGCYSMALNAALEREGKAARAVNTNATVHFGKDDSGFAISRIDLEVSADVPGIDAAEFQKIAEKVKQACPVSKALAAVPIELNASLANG
jgi:lipoyl-dependent peroxiredoxin